MSNPAPEPGVKTAAEFLAELHAHTTGNVFLTALGAGPPSEAITRQAAAVERFVRRNDKPGRDGLYHCVSTIDGERRNKEAAREAPAPHVDVDGKDILISLEAAAEILRSLRCPPSRIVWSGNGLHPYWYLTEPFDVQAEQERYEALLRRLADKFAGDYTPAHCAALMRLPGTHNRKNGAEKFVTIEGRGRELEYEFDDLEEWLDEQPVAIERKIKQPVVEPEASPFLQAAREYGWKRSLDVDAELAAMAKGNIHHTCVRVSASMLSRGATPEEAVGRLLPEIERALLAAGDRFNARLEERRVRQMCRSWIAKHPNVQSLPKRERKMSDERRDEPAEVHSFGPRAAAKPKPDADEKPAMPAMVADGVIAAIRDRGMDVMLAEGAMWLYGDGVWREAEAADEQRIRALIQEGCAFFGKQHDSKTANAAWKLLNEHPGLLRTSVPWLSGGVIACRNGLLDVLTREFTPFRPDAYARRKIGAAYEAGADCPIFRWFVDTLFVNRAPEARAKAVGLLQEWFGTMFAVHLLYREERKALLLLGPSRTGKTELARIARRLVGEPVAGPAVAEISERFGLSTLYQAAAWIRDDAINEGDKLDPQRWKTIVTGEPVDIERKNQHAIRSVEMNIPVLLTTNALPRARDASDAIFNRAMVLELTSVMDEDAARELRARIGVPRGQGLAHWIFEQEAPGILNWALDGLARLLERGQYDPPEFAKEAGQRFKDENNPVGEFARANIRATEFGRVARHDLMCAYHGWQREQEGDEARAAGARWFFPRLRAAVPGIGDTQDDAGTRYLTGLALTDEGIQHWERHIAGPQLKGGNKGFATSREKVNQTWNKGQPDEGTPF